jgi:hypothetical protein
MPHHCDDSDYGSGPGRRHALARVIVGRPSSVALDTGDADEFTFSGAGDFACFRELYAHEQATVTVAS